MDQQRQVGAAKTSRRQLPQQAWRHAQDVRLIRQGLRLSGSDDFAELHRAEQAVRRACVKADRPVAILHSLPLAPHVGSP